MLPVGATLTGVLFLGESLSLPQSGALVVALTGIVLATRPARQEPHHRRRRTGDR